MQKLSVNSQSILLIIFFFLLFNPVNAQDEDIDCHNKFDQCNLTFELFLVDSSGEKHRSVFQKEESYNVQVFVTNNSSPKALFISSSQFSQFRLELRKNGEIVSYLKETQDTVTFLNKDYLIGRNISRMIEPNKTELFEMINLSDWYESLTEGVYSLSVEYRPDYKKKFKHIGNLSFEIK